LNPAANPYASSETQPSSDEQAQKPTVIILARIGVHAFGLINLSGGVLSLYCLIAYIKDTDSSPSRYQALQGPFIIWAMLLPVLLVAAFVYHRASGDMSHWERAIFGICVLLPTVAMLLVLVVSTIAD
jgi:hypothetical protein